MLFKNNKKEDVMVRVDDKSEPTGYSWKNVGPGAEIELPERLGLKVGLEPLEVKKPEEKEVEKKLADVKEDLEDDGKRNYSHDPKRKSPGRKKTAKKVKKKVKKK